MKKAQIDMMGLVIIVVLIIFIGMFSLFFIVREDASDRDIYYKSKVNNFANAIAKYDKGNVDVSELVLKCCEGVSRECDTLLEFVDSSFGFVDEDVIFELECFSEKTYSHQRSNCEDKITSESQIWQSGDLIRLYLCI